MLSSHLNTRSTAVIGAWLEDVQSTISQAHQPPTSNSRKRSRSLNPYQFSARKRFALATAEGNVMTSPKRYADHNAEDPNTPKSRQILIYSDDTPRARPSQLYTTSLINNSIPDPLDRPATPSTDSATRSSKSKQFGRVSPVNGLGSLMMTENPVKRSDTISEVPSSGRNLNKELSRCKSAHGVLPSALKEDIIMAIGENDFLIDSMFASSCPSLDLRAELAQVKDILARAQKCGALQDAEPGWNEQVHSRVLELALNDQARVGFQNITTAKIFPPALNPKNINGTRLGGKMVDYAICLEVGPTEPMFNRIRTAMQLEPIDSQYINHTSFEPVRF